MGVGFRCMEVSFGEGSTTGREPMAGEVQRLSTTWFAQGHDAQSVSGKVAPGSGQELCRMNRKPNIETGAEILGLPCRLTRCYVP